MLNCHEASFLISQEHERRLSLSERMKLRLHLGICRACRNFARDAPLLGRAARALADDDGRQDGKKA